MLPIRHGIKSLTLGIHDPYPFQCPNCRKLDTVSFAIYCEYYHFWYLPILPFDKDGYAVCENCNFQVNSLKFNRLTREDFKVISKKFKYPYYTYTGAALILSPFVVALILFLLPSRGK